ncbi:YkvI family membrane protein [Marilutibacter aestuarii]|uniref:GerAB/ArcD/ProY family transporter n=1 Tax=Marilutibacter aestuarii TaxID=1706195 RepID=A0A508ATC2_9GAMM|nr:hypothetical protein [Lysobacter aestuarii]TQD51741.1 hypothetical protein FKV25_00250 [Lysobacter aestuarii]
MSGPPTWFQRYLLPGLAFKSVVIGGGYATGRELAEFFMPSGPRGGVQGMLLAMLIWSLVCAATFMFAQATRSFEYQRFFRTLLGSFWGLFEAAYVLFLVLILAVFGAAAGAIVQAMSGAPLIVGTLCLMAGTGIVAAFGNRAVERLFKWASLFLYSVYALFLLFSLSTFGDRILAGFEPAVATTGWALGGLTYAGYNIVGAVIVLPVARHFLSRRDALVAGVLAGPLAMLPALLFFVCMVAWYPAIANETLPSDYMLRQLGRPWFHLLFQAMIFLALLESGVGAVHAINERVSAAWRARRQAGLPVQARLLIATVLLVGSIFIADRFGLVALIAQGYRALSWLFLLVYVLPLLTLGGAWLWRHRAPARTPAP